MVQIRALGDQVMLFLNILFILFLSILIDYAITVLPFPPLYSPLPCTPLPPASPPTLVHVHGSGI